jgi:hypothetical protein
VEAHLALGRLGRAEVVHDVGGRLVGLRQQDAAGVLLVDHRAQLGQEVVGLGVVLAVVALLLVEVGDRVEPEPVDAHVHPEPDDVEHGLVHRGVLEVEIWLMGEEPVPEELPSDRVEGPVRHLGVDEDDARVGVRLVGVGPDVEVTERPLGVGARRLEPRVLVARVVHHEVSDDADAPGMRLRHELLEVGQGSELGQHRGVVGDVVATVAQRRGIERRQPQAVDAEPLEVVQSVDQPGEVTGSGALRVAEPADEHLVEHRGLEPLGVVLEPRLGQVEPLHQNLRIATMWTGSVSGPRRT